NLVHDASGHERKEPCSGNSAEIDASHDPAMCLYLSCPGSNDGACAPRQHQYRKKMYRAEAAYEIDLVNEKAGDRCCDHQRHPKAPQRLVQSRTLAAHEDDKADDGGGHDSRDMDLNGKRCMKKRFEVHRSVPVEFPVAFNKT